MPSCAWTNLTFEQHNSSYSVFHLYNSFSKEVSGFTLYIINCDAPNVFLLLQMMVHVNSILADSDYKIRQAEKRIYEQHYALKEQQMLQYSIFSKTIIILPTANLPTVTEYIVYKFIFYASVDWFFFTTVTYFQLHSFMYYFMIIEILLVKVIILKQQVHVKNEKYNFHNFILYINDMKTPNHDTWACVLQTFLLTFDRHPRGKKKKTIA